MKDGQDPSPFWIALEVPPSCISERNADFPATKVKPYPGKYDGDSDGKSSDDGEHRHLTQDGSDICELQHLDHAPETIIDGEAEQLTEEFHSAVCSRLGVEKADAYITVLSQSIDVQPSDMKQTPSADDPRFQDAILTELRGLLSRGVFVLTSESSLREGANILGSRSHLTIKHKNENVRYKARLVVRGPSRRREGVHCARGPYPLPSLSPSHSQRRRSKRVATLDQRRYDGLLAVRISTFPCRVHSLSPESYSCPRATSKTCSQSLEAPLRTY